ncbi:hypothetical protein A2933_02260 [Candidatus Nomurabacteria bacterium RIFCSPLOWO2_01_FULL_46_18]|uniref:Transcription elongation factor GreA n=1 Tax=Candidatus Nomurabacteria bacterium RIFCSPLOWO2_01_FULL_46_18 TaxID=1801783 RepID=A0A1F6XEA7_9BACT|nr:MAG: hypothetical protein A2933_02260 [Candidatus Nomurabacteria bacterium RIFCSPLOWO2_01_FULL_46_18]
MKATGSYITKEKKQELELELVNLKGPKRKEIIESLEYAKSLGDLSENAEYHQTREDQGKLEARIAQIEQILQNSEVISRAGGEIVDIGSFVTMQKEGGKGEKTYQVVGALEADTVSGKISNLSPIGLAMFGKKKGDKISFKTPSGETVNYKITKVF